MAASLTVSEIHQLIDKNLHNFLTPPLYSVPSLGGEAVIVKQRPSVTKNYNDGAIRW